VTKNVKLMCLTLLMACLFAAPALAQPAEEESAAPAATAAAPAGGFGITFSGAFGAGLTTLGAAYGIGKLAAAAVESQARQPEVAGTIQISMIIAAALIEGFTFFALVICNGQNPWAVAG
jgi:F-type H+-transporting ATPase subunit c